MAGEATSEAEAVRRRHVRGMVMLMVVVLAWGAGWPVNKALLAHMPPIWSVALRSVVSALALFAISLSFTGLVAPKREDTPCSSAWCCCTWWASPFWRRWRCSSCRPGQSTVLAYTSVLWAPVLAWLLIGERLSRARAAGLGLGVLGLVVIFNPLAFDWSDGRAIAGNAALLVAAFLWGLSIVHNRAHAWQSTPFQLAPWQALLAAAILSAIAGLVEGTPVVDWNATSVALLLFAGIPGTALAYWAAAVSSSDLPASTTSLGLLGVPAVSVVVALLLLGEQPTLALIIALALILTGVAVGMLGSKAPASER